LLCITPCRVRDGGEYHSGEAGRGADRGGFRLHQPAAEELGVPPVEQVYDHQGNIGNGTVPLLVLDMWEHAYYLQHENVKGDWVKAFWKLVDWSDVAKRFSIVRTLDLVL
jgi:Iron/manganese superoxide dismutases, C-terminal domain